MSASVTARPRTTGSDFAALNRQIVNAGLLERPPFTTPYERAW